MPLIDTAVPQKLTGFLTDGDRENEEPKLLAKHIAALIKASPLSQIMVFIERNLDDTRPVRVREKTLRYLHEMGVNPRLIHFARSPYKNKPEDRGVGVHTDHNIKCWSVHHTTEMMRDDRLVIWRNLVHINEHRDRPKLTTLKNYLENLEWVPIRGKALSATDDTDSTPSGKDHGPDDVAMALVFAALWMAVAHSSPTIQLFSQLTVPIPFPTLYSRRVVETNSRRIVPV